MTPHEEGPTAGGRSPDDPHEWGGVSLLPRKNSPAAPATGESSHPIFILIMVIHDK